MGKMLLKLDLDIRSVFLILCIILNCMYCIHYIVRIIVILEMHVNAAVILKLDSGKGQCPRCETQKNEVQYYLNLSVGINRPRETTFSMEFDAISSGS